MMPALLTRMSRRPNCSTAVSTSACAPAVVATSLVSATAAPPAATISAATSDAGPASAPTPSIEPPRSLTTTLAPRSASRSACARPMPRPAPVTTATRPSKLCSFTSSLMARHPCRRVPTSHSTFGLLPPVAVRLSSDRVGVITLNRPEARNAVDREMALGLEAAVDRLEDDPDVWVGVLCAQHRRIRRTPCSARAPTSRSSRRPAPRRRSTPSAAGSAGSCFASARSRSWSPSTGSRPRAGWRSSSPPTSSSRRHDRRSAWRRFAATSSPRPAGSSGSRGRSDGAWRWTPSSPVSRSTLVAPMSSGSSAGWSNRAPRWTRRCASRSRSSRRRRSRCAAAGASSSSAAYEHDDTLRQVSRELFDELLASDDASEGLAAFAEKRPPQWQGR